MIEIEIDGQKLEVKEGSMIIQAADDAGIYIPRFCYHKKLSIAANCRMCLVEVEKAPKTLPACATPVTPGMKVFTQSEKTLASQKAVMEFLLINHPLDCPICDQGGECELQDLSMGYGAGVSRYNQGKRSIEDKDLGPLISSDMTRCIYCTRCVRFGDEVAGMRELGGTGRGEETEIGTYVQQAIQSEVSGNVIDLCPVGALTSKPYRFSARAWEMRQHAAIAPHDCLGSNIFIHTRGEQYSPQRHVMRVVPRENETINETWISDRDRYSYEAINSDDRVTEPMVKRNGVWEKVSWDVALNETIFTLKNIIQTSGAEKVGALISPSATTEEMYLFQQWMRALGVQNIDHRIQQTDVKDQEYASLYPTLGFPIAEFDTLNTCFLIGSDMRREQPVANIRLRKAVQRGARVMCVNPVDYEMNFSCEEKLIAAGKDLIRVLAEISQVLWDKTKPALPPALASLIQSVTPSDASRQIAETLFRTNGTKAVILGAYASNHSEASVVRLLSEVIAALLGASLGCLTQGANTAGGWLAGALPHRGPAGQRMASTGFHARKMFESSLRSYVMFGLEPERDTACSGAALKALKDADVVVAFSSFFTQHLEAHADIILPIATFAENTGTYVNVEGKWQTMTAAGLPKEHARAGWDVLKELVILSGKTDVDYDTAESVCQELKEMVAKTPLPSLSFEQKAKWFEEALAQKLLKQISHPSDELERIGHWPMYHVDMLTRQAKSLQATNCQSLAVVRVHANVANQFGLKEGTVIRIAQNDQSITLPLVIDNRVADGYVDLSAGLNETAGFGDVVGKVELSA